MIIASAARQLKPGISRMVSSIRMIAPRLQLWQRKRRVRTGAREKMACVHFFFFPSGSMRTQSYQATQADLAKCMHATSPILHIPLINGSSIMTRLRKDEVLVSIEPAQITLHDKCRRGILTIHGLGMEQSWHVHVDETRSVVTSKFAQVLKQADKEMPAGIFSLKAGDGMQIEFTPSRN